MATAEHSVFRIVRGIGAATLLGATATFMFREWWVMDQTPAYVSLLVTTVLLAMAGLGCGVVLREAKGARTFLALALLTVPVNFAALGGLVHGAVHASETSVTAAPWWAVVLGVGVLAAIAWTGFRALARAHAWQLSGALLASCALLLVPVRALSFVTPALGLALIAASVYDRMRLHVPPSLRTFEGQIARAVLFMPPALLAGRTIYYYEITAAFVVVLAATTAWLLWSVSGYADRPWLRSVLRAFAVIGAGVASIALPAALGGPADYEVLVSGLPFAAVLAVMGVSDGQGPSAFQWSAASVAGCTTAIQLASEPTWVAAAAGLLVGAAVAVWGYGTRRAGGFLAGLGLCGGALGTQVVQMVELHAFDHWITFAVLGAALVILASLLERHRSRLARGYRLVRARFRPFAEETAAAGRAS